VVRGDPELDKTALLGTHLEQSADRGQWDLRGHGGDRGELVHEPAGRPRAARQPDHLSQCLAEEGCARAPGPTGRMPPGIAPLVRSAYAHNQKTCLSPGLASLDRLGQPAVLVGRGGEYALIGAFLDRAAADGAIPLRGEPGAGRTVLLDAAADGASAAGAWVLRAGEARELADRPPPRWTRQESPERRHMAGEVPSAPCPTVSRRGYPRPAVAYTAAGRTGGDIPTICGWKAPDEPARTKHR
jgi:hypothetical protein